MKVVFFILFLIFYITSLVAGNKIQQWQQKKFSRILALFTSIVSSLFFFLFIWVLTGFRNFTLVGAFVVIQIFGYVLTKLLLTFLGTDDEEKPLNQMLALGAEWGLRHPLWFFILGIFAVLSLTVYPIVIGIVYFYNEIPSDEGTQSIIKYFLILNFVIANLMGIPQSIGALSSKNIQEDTRTMIMVVQISGLFANAMWLSLALWALGLADTKWLNVPVGENILVVSPILLIILFGFFGLFVLAPYLLGSKRAKKWRQSLLKKQYNMLEKLTAILEFPKLQSLDLVNLQEEVKGELAQLREKREIVEIEKEVKEIDSAEVDEDILQIFEAEKQTRHLDPRFIYYKFLERFQHQLEILISDLSAEDRVKTLEYARIYRDQKDEVIKNIQDEDTKNPQLYALIIFILTAISAPIVSTFGKWAWEMFMKNPS